jgi:hypothetical protein
VSPVKYELGFYIPEDDILHSQSRENLKSYTTTIVIFLTCAANPVSVCVDSESCDFHIRLMTSLLSFVS